MKRNGLSFSIYARVIAICSILLPIYKAHAVPIISVGLQAKNSWGFLWLGGVLTQTEKDTVTVTTNSPNPTDTFKLTVSLGNKGWNTAIKDFQTRGSTTGNLIIGATETKEIVKRLDRIAPKKVEASVSGFLNGNVPVEATAPPVTIPDGIRVETTAHAEAELTARAAMGQPPKVEAGVNVKGTVDVGPVTATKDPTYTLSVLQQWPTLGYNNEDGEFDGCTSSSLLVTPCDELSATGLHLAPAEWFSDWSRTLASTDDFSNFAGLDFTPTMSGLFYLRIHGIANDPALLPLDAFVAIDVSPISEPSSFSVVGLALLFVAFRFGRQRERPVHCVHPEVSLVGVNHL